LKIVLPSMPVRVHGRLSQLLVYSFKEVLMFG
jgi:hypothetical protein